MHLAVTAFSAIDLLMLSSQILQTIDLALLEIFFEYMGCLALLSLEQRHAHSINHKLDCVTRLR